MKITIPYKPRSYQQEVHDLMDSHRFFVLVAHRRLGKTVLSINQLIKRAIKDNKPLGRYAYIAPFRNQGKDIAWNYLLKYVANIPGCRKYENDLKIRFYNKTEIRIFGADNPDNLRGQYFDGVIMDEVAQIKRELWEEVIRPAISDRRGWVIFIGTPHGINLFYELYQKGRQGADGWGAALYDITRTLAAPDPPLSADEVANCRQEMTRDNFAREYDCDFNASTVDTLIPLGLAVEAAKRRLALSRIGGHPVVFGVDVARFGDDDSAICVRQGPAVLRVWSGNGLATDELISQILQMEGKWRPEIVCVDSGGGQGVIDYGRKTLMAAVLEVPFGSRAIDDSAYADRRSEMWSRMRKFLEDGGAIPPDDTKLVAQLASPTFWYDGAGRIRLEPKEKIKKRLAQSPDLADAMALTFAVDVLPQSLRGKAPRKAVASRPFWGPEADWI